MGAFAPFTFLKGVLGFHHEKGQDMELEHIVIYEDSHFYSAFPSIVIRPDGKVLVAFRRAPERRSFGENRVSHTDPNSYLVLVQSGDNGRTWSTEPRLIYAHPFGGSQDPCMLQLRDGTILCASYGWALINEKVAETRTDTLRHGGFVFLGGYLLRSQDGGVTWQEPIIPPPLPDNPTHELFGKPCPAYNRGAMCEGKDGRLYWVVVKQVSISPRTSSVHLLISSDKGTTWEYASPVASDSVASFNETSLYETPKGDLVAFIRTADFDDHTVIARSTDGGKSFLPWEDAGFQGHPHHALRLPDERVFLIYGYRHQPYGIRARILNSECTDFRTAPEIVLRDDGGSTDVGYPWAALLPDGRILAVYYFNTDNGTRQIAGTFISL